MPETGPPTTHSPTTGSGIPANPVNALPTVSLLGEDYYVIRDYDQLAPFFMSVVSSSDHWLFLSSTGGLTAGRIDANGALFPYYTEDKLTESSEHTGPKTILRVRRGDQEVRWEPFSAYTVGARVERHLYKSVLGHAVLFEETRLDLGLRFRYAWRSGDRFGFVRSAWLTNLADNDAQVEVLDGVQNVLPAGVTSQLTNELSLLLDAYKVSEVDTATGLGVYAMNASLSDRAEPSESLRANTIWSVNLPHPQFLASNTQLGAFRQGQPLQAETLVRGVRGAYFTLSRLNLPAGESQQWHLVAEVRQDGAEVANLRLWLASTPQADILSALEDDLAQNGAELRALLARVDGLQLSGDERAAGRHLANTLFNAMRGGLFMSGDQLEAADLRDFVAVRNRVVLAQHSNFFDTLPERLTITELRERVSHVASPDLQRLCACYLPLTFSRRHGDPSRPWNRFAIHVKRPDGSRNLDYQGNWRDIFQNWEPLAYAYPAFLPNMLATFLNATTADGYNPYRVTRSGLEWEEPEPENPWANIGYWSDHQIIYLQKLLEVAQNVQPGQLAGELNRRQFSHAQVPYQIKPYTDILRNGSDTITFDHELNAEIHSRVEHMGTDGKLLLGPDGQIIHVSLTEKLLTLLLAKLVNLVPEGGLWMNTQRPEWNDANNALVGKGLSVVTVAYLHRFLGLLDDLLQAAPPTLTLTPETADWLAGVQGVLTEFQPHTAGTWTPEQRRAFIHAMGEVGTRYRQQLYERGLSGDWRDVEAESLRTLTRQARAYVGQILRQNRREDGLYHAYNLLRLNTPSSADIDHLPEMLEGQVAILSAGILNPDEALDVLQALRNSALYTPDRHSYLLYPDRPLKSFFEKNRVHAEQVQGLELLRLLDERQDGTLLRRDDLGEYHFNGEFRNAGDLNRALDALERDESLRAAVQAARQPLLDLFEEVFDHDSFTGRSGTFFAYEGLGSIYWHMVSKLLLAAQEQVLSAADQHSDALPGLLAAYEDIRSGLSFNRTDRQYGAFPTDPYSHTPAHRGAQQPGMTGQVKEELLTRPAELGLRVHGGTLHFDPLLIHEREWLTGPHEFRYLDVHGDWQTLNVPAGAFAFTWAQVPITVQRGEQSGLRIHWQDANTTCQPHLSLDPHVAAHIFKRDGQVTALNVTLRPHPFPVRSTRAALRPGGS